MMRNIFAKIFQNGEVSVKETKTLKLNWEEELLIYTPLVQMGLVQTGPNQKEEEEEEEEEDLGPSALGPFQWAICTSGV